MAAQYQQQNKKKGIIESITNMDLDWDLELGFGIGIGIGIGFGLELELGLGFGFGIGIGIGIGIGFGFGLERLHNQQTSQLTLLQKSTKHHSTILLVVKEADHR